jgi:hypothetical protein
MSILIAQANERHEMLWLGERADPLLGKTWEILGCPLCGYQFELCVEPHRKIVTRSGDDDLTAEDLEHIKDLTNAGQLEEARALMATQPGHYYQPGPIKQMGTEIVRPIIEPNMD